MVNIKRPHSMPQYDSLKMGYISLYANKVQCYKILQATKGYSGWSIQKHQRIMKRLKRYLANICLKTRELNPHERSES